MDSCEILFQYCEFTDQRDADNQDIIDACRTIISNDIHRELKECQLYLVDNLTFCEDRYIAEFIKVD